MTTKALTQLIRPPGNIARQDDVARIRRALNAVGFDATDSDIEWAYIQWSEDNWGQLWDDLGDHDDEDLCHAMYDYLECKPEKRRPDPRHREGQMVVVRKPGHELDGKRLMVLEWRWHFGDRKHIYGLSDDGESVVLEAYEESLESRP